MRFARVERQAQRLARPEQMRLTDHLIELLRPQAPTGYVSRKPAVGAENRFERRPGVRYREHVRRARAEPLAVVAEVPVGQRLDERRERVLAYANALETRAEDLARLLTAEQGKTLAFPPKGIEKYLPGVARGTWKP